MAVRHGSLRTVGGRTRCRLFRVHVLAATVWVWNVAAVSSEISHSASYRDTLIVKLVVVSISGITAALHARARSAVGLAVLAH